MSTLKTVNVQHPSSSNANLALDNSGNVAIQAGTVSAPAIYVSGDSNTGIYSPGANSLGFTTDGTQRGEFDASGNFKFNSGYGSVATAYGCRAWVNFNGSGTVAIRADGNVSSITDNNAGDYTVNFDVSMPDANYCILATTGNGDSTGGNYCIGIYGTGAAQGQNQAYVLAGSVRVLQQASNGTNADSDSVHVAIFR